MVAEGEGEELVISMGGRLGEEEGVSRLPKETVTMAGGPFWCWRFWFDDGGTSTEGT